MLQIFELIFVTLLFVTLIFVTLIFVPIIFVTLSYAANPKYISMLLVDPTGRSILALAATLYVTGLLWIRRLVSHRS